MKRNGFFSYLVDVYKSRELMVNLALREIKGKYKKTILGQLWSLVNPLAMMLVYTFVFSFVFRIQPGAGNPSGINSFALWLLCGLLPWLFFSRAITAGVSSLVANESLIQKVYFSRVVLPAADITAIAYNWLFEMGVLVVALLLVGAQLWITLPYILLAVLLLFLFTAGLGLIFSIINVFFRDTEHLVAVALQLWMYLTPVIYPLSLVEQQSEKIGPILGTPFTLLDIYQLNPMESFIQLFRTVMYDVTAPSLGQIGICAIWAVVSAGTGLFIYARKDRFLAEAM